MCTVCKTPLACRSHRKPNDERTFISGLIAQGETKAQILKAMVSQSGPACSPSPAHGFNVAPLVLPPGVLIIGAAILFYTLQGWRRRTQAATPPDRDAPAPRRRTRAGSKKTSRRYGR